MRDDHSKTIELLRRALDMRVQMGRRAPMQIPLGSEKPDSSGSIWRDAAGGFATVTLAVAVVGVFVFLLQGQHSSRPQIGVGAASSSMTASPAISPVPSLPPSTSPAPSDYLVVSPNHGPVGTTVTLNGAGCHNPMLHSVIVQFTTPNPLSPGGGSVEIDGPVDVNDHFTITFIIPPVLNKYQQHGGGPVLPGQYQFQSLPPACITDFTVDPS